MQFGVVGAGGYWGPNWVRVLKQVGALGAICEADEGRRRKVAERFELGPPGVEVLASYDEMLALDLEGIFVPTGSHANANLTTTTMAHRCGSGRACQLTFAYQCCVSDNPF